MKTASCPRIKIQDLPPIDHLTEEEAESILGSGRGRTVRLGVESLEDRLALTWSGLPPEQIAPHLASIKVGLNSLGAAAGSASITQSEIDWYRFVPAATGNYAVATSTPSSAIDTVLAAYAANGSRVGYNDNAKGSTDSSMSVALTQGQLYYFGVTNRTSVNGAYKWSISRPMADDALEQNDTQGKARDLGRLAGSRMVNNLALADNADWFRFTTSGVGAANSRASISFQNAHGNLNLYLHDAQGNLLAQSAGTGNKESVSLAGRAAGTYFIRVAGIANPSYSLRLDPPNNAPTLQEIPEAAGRHDAPIRIALKATDADADALTFQANVLGAGRLAPATASISGNILTLTPTERFVGDFEVRVTVGDREASATRTFRVNVTNAAPILAAIPDISRRHDSGKITIPLTANDADGDLVKFSATMVGEGASVSVLDNNLVITPREHYSGSFQVQVTASDGLAEDRKTFTVRVTNAAPVLAALPDQTLARRSTFSLDLAVTDTDRDAVTLSAEVLGDKGVATAAINGQRLTVTPRPDFAGSFQVRITATDGIATSSQMFTVTVTNAAPLLQPVTRQFIVSGRPRVIDLAVRDPDEGDVVTLASPRVQAGVPYTAEIKEGKLYLNPTADFKGDFEVVLTASDGATSVERTFTVTTAGFEELAYKRLLHPFADGGYRDAHGFVVARTGEGGQADELGDALIFTGLATATAALRRDDGAVRSLLQTLRDKPFDPVTGALIRHPDVYEWVKRNGEFVQDRHSPASKDGVLGVMTGVYYAFITPGMSDETRELAKQVMGKYIDYLIAHQWKTIDHYPDHYWDKHADDKKKFAHVFDGPLRDDGTERRVMWKGPESYLLAPNDIYALQNAAAHMGFVTSHWQPWRGFGAALVQIAGDKASQVVRDTGDRLAIWVGERFDAWLTDLRIHKEYSFHVIPGVDTTLVKGSLDIEISQADRRNIVATVEGAVRAIIQDYMAETIDNATEGPAYLNSFNDMIGRIADKILDHLPSWLDADRVRPVIIGTIQQAMPWMNGNAFGEILAFRLSHELAKTDEIVAHLSFWPTLLMYETRPEMVDLLGPSVHDLDSYLHDLTVDYANNRSEQGEFWDKDIRRMDMLLYAWMDREGERVEGWLNKFETDASYENLAYTWKKPHSENVEKILAGGKPEMNGIDTGLYRLDYLLLKGLQQHGVPRSAPETVGDWLRHWRDVLDNVANDAIRNLKRGASDAWVSIEKAVEDLVASVNERYSAARDAIQGRIDDANRWLEKNVSALNNKYNDNVGAWRDWLNGGVKYTYSQASDWLGGERDWIVGDLGNRYNDSVGAWRDWLNGAVKYTYSQALDFYSGELDRIIDEWNNWYNGTYNWLRNKLEDDIASAYAEAAASLAPTRLPSNGNSVRGIIDRILDGFGLTGTDWLSCPDWGSLPSWAQERINRCIGDFNNAVDGFRSVYDKGVASVQQSYGNAISTLNSLVNDAGTNWLSFPDWDSLPSWAQEHINGYIGDFNNAVDGFRSEYDKGVASVQQSYGNAISTLKNLVNDAGTNWSSFPGWDSLPSWAQEHINGYIGDFNNAVDGFLADLKREISIPQADYDALVAGLRAELDGLLPHWQRVLDSGLADFQAQRQALVARWQASLDAGMGKLAHS